MRQISILLFFFSAFSLFGESWFISNSSGMLFEKIHAVRTGEYEWYARVDDNGSQVVKILYDRNGKEAKRWDIFKENGSVVKEVFTEGNSSTISEFENQRIMRETFLKGSKVTGSSTYSYDGNFLREIQEQDASGKIKNKVVLKRDASSRISGADFTYGSETFTNHYIFSRGRLIMEWHGIDSQTGTSVRYSQEGSLLNTTRWEKGSKVWEEKFEYTDNYLSGSVASARLTGEKTVKKFDASGNITYQEDTVDDEVVRKLFCAYDSESRLIDRTEVQDNLMERSKYKYDGDQMVQEQQYKNGKLVRIIEYASAENYTVDTYIDNVPVLRNYYIKHRKVKKEEWEKQGIGG
ncbi:MAG: hypothetical protein J6U56_03720 [Spirochaetia bacterium]|nr:hypothetical protein [Spirochaetia bacterium]